MESRIEQLATHPFLQDMSTSLLNRLVSSAYFVQFHDGEYIFRRGETADKLFLIQTGKVILEISPGKKHSEVNILAVPPGEVLGWSWLIPPYEWQFDAKASALVQAIALDAKYLRKRFEHDHELGYEILHRFLPVIANRLKATRLQFWELYKLHYLL